MNSSDIINVIIIILIYGIINITIVLAMGIDHVKDNWNSYKCMPIVIPFSGVFGHNPNDVFNQCTESLFKNFLSTAMSGIYKVLIKSTAIGEQIGSAISSLHSVSLASRFNLTNSIGTIYQIATRLLLGINHFTIIIEGLIQRILGVMMTVIYIILGVNVSVLSIWNGLPGQIIRFAANLA